MLLYKFAFIFIPYIFIHYRYLSRAVLVPFAYKAPPVTADILEDILTNAPAAIQDVIRIGRDVVDIDSSTLNLIAEKIKGAVGMPTLIVVWQCSMPSVYSVPRRYGNHHLYVALIDWQRHGY